MSARGSMSRLDLNLLVALDALLAERSVTRAAERLHLSQPSMSGSLARLRTHFGDVLLARRGNSYELTPLATRLAEQVTPTLEAARRIFEAAADWDPSESTREFSLYMSDYGLSTVSPIVSRIAAESAPGIRFRFMLHTTPIIDDARERLRSVDGIVLPHGFLTDIPYTDLWRDDWLVVADARHPAVAKGLTLDDLARYGWVFTYQSRTAFTSASRQLQQLGLEPRVDAIVESFLALPQFVIGTQRLGMIQGGVARVIRSMSDVAILRPPFDATPLSIALWWHPMHRTDQAHAWMREIFARAGRELSDQLEADAAAPSG